MRRLNSIIFAVFLLIASDNQRLVVAQDKSPDHKPAPAVKVEDNHVSVFTESAQAADKYPLPKQELVAPDTVDPGELVVAKVSDVSNAPTSFAGATYRWLVTENTSSDVSKFSEKVNIQVWPGGTSVVFGAGVGAKKFHVVLSASYLYLTKDSSGKITGVGQRAKVFRKVITVGNPQPAPGPGPNPNPSPAPVFPDGKYGLSKTAWQYATDSVPVASRAGSKALATSMRGVASQIAAGTLKNMKDILTTTKSANQTALKSANVSLTDWDGFFTKLQDSVYKLYDTNKMSTIDDVATAWKEIADGLDKVQ